MPGVRVPAPILKGEQIMNTNTNTTNNTMIKCTRDVILICIGQHVYNELGEALMPIKQQNVEAVSAAIKTAVQKLLPAMQLSNYNIYDIYECAMIAWHNDKHAHVTLDEYDSWLTDMLEAIRGLDIPCDIEYSDEEDMDIDWPIYIYRDSLPELFGIYLASTSTDYDKEYRILPYLNGTVLIDCCYADAVKYIDEHLGYTILEEIQLTEAEYRSIWNAAIQSLLNK